MNKRLKRLETQLAKLRSEVEAEVGPVVELPSTGGTLRLATPSDAIYFDQGYSWPPRGSEAERVLEEAAEQALLTGEAAVCVAVDQERGTITFASSPLKPGGNGLVRPMDGSEARYLGLLYLEAQGWI